MIRLVLVFFLSQSNLNITTNLIDPFGNDQYPIIESGKQIVMGTIVTVWQQSNGFKKPQGIPQAVTVASMVPYARLVN